ncbi:hypothetical protein ZWY2020_028201 [Hordeum vulgare]|nr:hypothetical protein ZWY2020_028201 [Hordeum vulgare]
MHRFCQLAARSYVLVFICVLAGLVSTLLLLILVSLEGQVKEKTCWCQLLKDLSEKFKALKIEHQMLLKESVDYKKCL